MNRTEIAGLLALCAAAYPHVGITKETAIVYAEMLADIDVAVAKQAVERLIVTSQYFPTVAAIREQSASILSPSAPSLASAWDEVISQVRKVGHRSRPEWSHESIARAVSTLGWREICMSENQTAIRAHFFKVYEVIGREFKQASILPAKHRELKT